MAANDGSTFYQQPMAVQHNYIVHFGAADAEGIWEQEHNAALASGRPAPVPPPPAAPPEPELIATATVNVQNKARLELVVKAQAELERRAREQVAAGILTQAQADFEKKKAEIAILPGGNLDNVDPNMLTNFISGSAAGVSFGESDPVKPTQEQEPPPPEGGPPPPPEGGPPPPPEGGPPPPPPEGGEEEIELLGGIDHRRLELDIATQAAQQAYLRSRLSFETEDASRGRALEAARLAVNVTQFNQQFSLESFQQLRGPSNYGQLFNLFGGSPAAQGGLPSRFAAALSGRPVAAVPGFDAEAVRNLGFERQMATMFNIQPQNETGAGAAPLPTFDPRQIAPESFSRLLPSEQQALLSIGSAQGFPVEDALAIINSGFPGGNAYPLAPTRVGTGGLRP